MPYRTVLRSDALGVLSRIRELLAKMRDVTNRITGNERANYPRKVAVFEPNHETISFIRNTQCRFIAEIGIYNGHTSMEFAKYLNGNGELHLFDYVDRVTDVASKIKDAGFQNVRTFGSTYKLLDSYNWSIAKLLERNHEPIYDYVFLDGAHTWAVDALTALLIDRLIKVGGYLDFDDYDWTLAGSPSLNPKIFPLTGKLYSDEQIETKQVKMIIDLLVRSNPRYREVVPNKIFQKIA